MTADGCSCLVAEVCIEHVEYWDNPGLLLKRKKHLRFKIQHSRKNLLRLLNLESQKKENNLVVPIL